MVYAIVLFRYLSEKDLNDSEKSIFLCALYIFESSFFSNHLFFCYYLSSSSSFFYKEASGFMFSQKLLYKPLPLNSL